MIDFTCKKCGDKNFFLKQVGNKTGIATGLYCSQCQSWDKWVSKGDLPAYIKEADEFQEAPVVTSSILNVPPQVDRAAILDVIRNIKNQLEALEMLVGDKGNTAPSFPDYNPMPYQPLPYTPSKTAPRPEDVFPNPYEITCKVKDDASPWD